MPNFTGNSRRPRNVNLSGRQTGANTQAASLRAAREERAAREAQRKKQRAVETIQRTWRGRHVTQQQREAWRSFWDESISKSRSRSLTQSEIVGAISLFVGFIDMGRKKRGRVWDSEDVSRTTSLIEILLPYDEDRIWSLKNPRKKFLESRLIRILVEAMEQQMDVEHGLPQIFKLLEALTSKSPQYANDDYYKTLSKITVMQLDETNVTLLMNATLGPLKTKTSRPYRAFGAHYLTTPDLFTTIGFKNTQRLKQTVLFDLLAANFVRDENMDTEGALWFLAYSIELSQYSSSVINLTDKPNSELSEEKNKFAFLTELLDSASSEVTKRINVQDEAANEMIDVAKVSKRRPLPSFVKKKIQSLVEKSSITSILSKTKSTDSDVQVLAKFVLTLMRTFPEKRDEVCMWLCLANTADGVPAVRYAWEGVKKCELFVNIQKDSTTRMPISYLLASSAGPNVEEEWHLLILFLEMYGFLLPISDDNEFFSSDPRGRHLPLSDVRLLTIFLKNVSFAAYWWAGELTGDDAKAINMSRLDSARGWDLRYLRTITTKVMRAVYARDSRQRFLPVDHWLMNKMTSVIITAVVQEGEERQSELLDQLENENKNSDSDSDSDMEGHNPLRRRARLEHLRTITPHLEILQNIPFFLQFPSRVQVFREFITNDQRKRRGGAADPDLWRNQFMQQGTAGRQHLSSHHARIRRGMEFDDAMEYYWEIGESLKEPIQITFVDKFGAEEAGIDGGGVTKEFLTGVCGEAFIPGKDGNGLFVENAEHLLYPDPTALERIKSAYVNDKTRRIQETAELLRRYEFAGRIIGKCLYEGILVDVAFAPFFLLKWSQPFLKTAVGVNDLRDLDADFYRHLMTLKNYPGDVESDFGLDFTVTTEIYPGKIITRDLMPKGSLTPVTTHNRMLYIHQVSNYRLVQEQAEQTNAFLRGLTTIIKPTWLQMFNQSELQTLIAGDAHSGINLEDLRRNTIYGGVYEIGADGREHDTIRLFWQVMKELDPQQQGQVLKFVTSVSRAPLLGFSALNPRFSIRDAGPEQGRLCSASTCVNLLKLPRYTNKAVLEERLLYSVNAKAGFDLS